MNRDISALTPAVSARCRALIALADKAGISICVTSTLRTQAEQRALYAQGRRSIDEVNALRSTAGMGHIKEAANRPVTNARVSMHEFSCAFDIAVAVNGRITWDTQADINNNGMPEYDEVGQMGESLGMRWGGRFRTRDLCHFEYTGGLSINELQAGHRPGGDINSKRPSTGPLTSPARTGKETKKMDKTKAGLKSTEFYMAVLGALLPVMNTHLAMDIPVSGVMSIAGVVMSYILSRTFLKRG